MPYSRYNPRYRGCYRKPFRKTRGFCILIIIIAGIVGFFYWSIHRTVNLNLGRQKFTDQAGAPIQAGQITFVSGLAQLKSPSQPWQDTAENYQIKAGDSLRTGPGAKAIAVLPDRSEIRLAENAEIKFDEMSASDIVIKQISGNAYHRVNDQSTAIYRVKNGDTELTALGTAFNVLASSQLTYLTVVDSSVKIKIYSNDNIVNMRTIESGARATINSAQSADKMITTETVQAADLINEDWFAWNIGKDRDEKRSLGMFGDMIKLEISEPDLPAQAGASLKAVNADKLKIKGATDAAADIYVSGRKLENKNGNFETEVPLSPGDNKIEVTVKKGGKFNKKIINVSANTQKQKILLSGAITNKNNVALTWKAADLGDFKNFQILKSSSLNAVYPGDENHSADKTVLQDGWNNLNNGHYFFRVCAFTEDGKCAAYSNDFEATIGQAAADSGSDIIASASSEANNVKLAWTLADGVKAPEGFKTIISQSENPVYPGNSYHTVGSTAASDVWQKLAPGKYFFRVCLLTDGACSSYSNNVSGTAKEATSPITLRGSADGDSIGLNWTVSKLDVSKGFKVVMDEHSNVIFPGKNHHLITSSAATSDQWNGLDKGTIYYFRACQNTGTTVGVCSNEVSIELK
ncbi:MAG: FecR domain-containing protein [Parcubacteria group bacterium]